MDSLSAVIRARIRLLRRVRVLTAQSNLSAKVLIAMPVVMFFAMNILNPEYMEPLYNSHVGKILLGATVISVLVGWWMMTQIAKLRY